MLELEGMMRISIRDVMGQAIMDYTQTKRPRWMQKWAGNGIYLLCYYLFFIRPLSHLLSRSRTLTPSPTHLHSRTLPRTHTLSLSLSHTLGMCVLNGSQMHWTKEMEELFLAEGRCRANVEIV